MSDKKYIGMTVNERLYTAKLFDRFYKAVDENNLAETILILKKVDLTEQTMSQILENMGLHK